MTTRAAIDAALSSAHRQLMDLQSGDIDAFLADVESHARTCLALSRMTLRPGDEHRLHELLAINASISRTLSQLREEVRVQLSSAHTRSRLPAAYLAS